MTDIAKDIVSTLPLLVDTDKFQNMNTENSDKNNEILLNKDCLSTWIQNKQFLSQIGNNKINELQNDIISTVFGDFNGLLSSLLKYYDDRCMTHLQQLKLNNILSKVHPTSIN
eukprot:98119_1